MPQPVQFKVRRARLEDLGRVSSLERRVWKEMAASRAAIQRRFFLFPQGFKVAVTPSDLAGFCFSVLFDQDAREVKVDEFFPPHHVPRGKFLFMFGLTVNPVYRQRGVGASLVRRQVAEGLRRRCRKMQLVANDFSRPLFERHGFRTVDSLRHVFAQFPDLMPHPVLMEKNLAGA